MFQNPSQTELKNILQNTRKIAVVGLSSNPERESYAVSAEMQKRGFTIVPVNPNESEVLGKKAVASLDEIPDDVDIINVFRRSDALPGVVQDAVKTKVPVIWAQQDIFDEEAADIAKQHDKTMVMDLCIMVAHSVLVKSHLS